MTLIELMIAMVLGLLISAAVIQLFVNNKQTYRITQSQTQLQNNARFALSELSKIIRSSGFTGCRTVERIDVHVIASAPASAAMEASTTITGNDSWPANTTSNNFGLVKEGSDVITVQRAESCGATLVGSLASASAEIKVHNPNSCNLQENQILMISDCKDAHIFKTTQVVTIAGGTKQNIVHTVNNGSTKANDANFFCKGYPEPKTAGSCTAFGKDDKLYGTDAEIYNFISESYFIREDSNGNAALWVYDNNSATETVNPGTLNPKILVEGISDMQIDYGVDDNNDDVIDDYKTAQAVTTDGEWHKVISAKLSLLVETQETGLRLNDQELTYNGVTTTETDGRIRRIYTSTIGIRNRVQ